MKVTWELKSARNIGEKINYFTYMRRNATNRQKA